MEEYIERMKLKILDQQVEIKISDIVNLVEVINIDSIHSISKPFCFSKFEIDMKVLHICLYYIIVIDKNMVRPQLSDIREKMLERLSNYYIKRKMTLEIYQYAYICCKISSINLERCMHILYFLIYGRLASKPYVRMLIRTQQNLSDRNQIKKKTERVLSFNTKSQDSRRYTVYFQNDQFQVNSFVKQLKNTLYPQLASSKKKDSKHKNQNRRYFNLKKIYPSADHSQKQFEEQSNTEIKDENITLQEGSHYNTPSKVIFKEHSSIINQINSYRRANSTPDHKFQLRKQKFNQNFTIEGKFLALKSSDTPSNKQNLIKSFVTQNQAAQVFSSNQRHQKKSVEYFKNMTNNISSFNENLDDIRYECLKKIKKPFKAFSNKNQPKRKIENLNEIETVQQNKILTKRQSLCQINCPSLHNLDTEHEVDKKEQQKCSLSHRYLVFKSNRHLRESQLDRQLNRDKEQKYNLKKSQSKIGLTKSTSRFNASTKSNETFAFNYNQNILRKNEMLVKQDSNILIFNKKVKNKYKLQKYKAEYRSFIKTQIFERINQIY